MCNSYDTYIRAATRGTSYSGGFGGGGIGGAVSYNGGGLIIIKANHIKEIGQITSNGVDGRGDFNDKAGGGSGGGVIRILANSIEDNLNYTKITSKGGIGANKSKAKAGDGGNGSARISILKDGKYSLVWKYDS